MATQRKEDAPEARRQAPCRCKPCRLNSGAGSSKAHMRLFKLPACTILTWQLHCGHFAIKMLGAGQSWHRPLTAISFLHLSGDTFKDSKLRGLHDQASCSMVQHKHELTTRHTQTPVPHQPPKIFQDHPRKHADKQLNRPCMQ